MIDNFSIIFNHSDNVDETRSTATLTDEVSGNVTKNATAAAASGSGGSGLALNLSVHPVIKPEFFENILRAPCALNVLRLNELLEANIIEEIDDVMTIIVGKKGYGVPFQTTTEYLIKRQDDHVSGNLPFTQTVSISLYINLHMFLP